MCVGDEFYIKAWPILEGRTFNEVLISFPMATPVGLKLAASGAVVLNPESDYVMEAGATAALRRAALCHHCDASLVPQQRLRGGQFLQEMP